MRGKGTWSFIAGAYPRITPAYAGKRITVKRGSRVSRDHPRLCGEKYVPRILRCFHRGSPPPMRGKAYCKTEKEKHKRITPAYAGKRWHGILCEFTYQDHPRLCGEKLRRNDPIFSKSGSPPPMRGKGSEIVSNGHENRITPAYAGKSLLNFRCLYPTRDHPRLCGEKE